MQSAINGLGFVTFSLSRQCCRDSPRFGTFVFFTSFVLTITHLTCNAVCVHVGLYSVITVTQLRSYIKSVKYLVKGLSIVK